MNKLFEKLQLKNQDLILKQGEKSLFSVGQVGIYENNSKLPQYDSGTLKLTSHRIAFIPTDDSIAPIEISLHRIKNTSYQTGFLRSSPKVLLTLEPVKRLEIEWTCSICQFENKNILKCLKCGVKTDLKFDGIKCNTCTFLNHSEMVQCEICETLLEKVVDVDVNIKLSFRNGGQPEILLYLEQALKDQQWLIEEKSKIQGQGVGAILSNFESRKEQTRQTIQDSFQDLDQLMKQANQVTSLVQSILSKVQSPNQDNDFQRQLLELGMVQQVKSSGSEYHKQLSRELLQFLKSYSKQRQVKVVSLSDVYCLFNRARGSVLISPQDLLKAAGQLSETDEFYMRTFSSGVAVLESRDYRDESFTTKILDWITKMGHCTPLEMAQEYSCSVLVGKELLLSMEQKGMVCRDDTIYGLFFYPNLFI